MCSYVAFLYRFDSLEQTYMSRVKHPSALSKIRGSQIGTEHQECFFFSL